MNSKLLYLEYVLEDWLPPPPPNFQHCHYRPSKLKTTLSGICAVGKFVKTPMPPTAFCVDVTAPVNSKLLSLEYICILCLESVSENWCKLYSPAATFSVGVTAPVNSKWLHLEYTSENWLEPHPTPNSFQHWFYHPSEFKTILFGIYIRKLRNDPWWIWSVTRQVRTWQLRHYHGVRRAYTQHRCFRIYRVGKTDIQTVRNLNSKTFSYKACSLGSVKNLSNN